MIHLGAQFARVTQSVLATTPELKSPGDGWQYAAWIALDLRLLFFLMFVSLLATSGVCLIVIKRRDWLQFTSLFIVSYALILSALIAVFNLVAHYPVFKVESLFPFP